MIVPGDFVTVRRIFQTNVRESMPLWYTMKFKFSHDAGQPACRFSSDECALVIANIDVGYTHTVVFLVAPEGCGWCLSEFLESV